MESPAIYGYVLAAAAAGVAAMRMHAAAMARDQQADSLDAWAAFNGYEPMPAPAVGRTPLLRLDGARRHVRAVPVGPQGGAIYRYSYTAVGGGDSTPVELTVVQALSPPAFPGFGSSRVTAPRPASRPTGCVRLTWSRPSSPPASGWPWTPTPTPGWCWLCSSPT
jgi:hypothetical protein